MYYISLGPRSHYAQVSEGDFHDFADVLSRLTFGT